MQKTEKTSVRKKKEEKKHQQSDIQNTSQHSSQHSSKHDSQINSQHTHHPNVEEVQGLTLAVGILEKFKERYSMTYEEVLALLKRDRELIPATVLHKKLSPLESIAKFLKEEHELKYHEIAVLTGRDERNIWHAYTNASQKVPQKISPPLTKYSIPLSVLAEKKLSILESIVTYLKEEYTLSYKVIAQLVSRNERTIWTVHHRAKQKIAKNQKSNTAQKTGRGERQ